MASSNSKSIGIVDKYYFSSHVILDKIKVDSLDKVRKSNFPTPGVEPGPIGWKPAILAVRPRGIWKQNGPKALHTRRINEHNQNNYVEIKKNKDW